jgi:DNA-binding MarR family transcriptional regulator
MPEPDQRLFFLLQRAAHQLRTASDRRLLAAAGITTAQLGALFAVRDEPGITQQRLARTLGLRESAVTGLVGRLTAAGLVAKRAHPHEHRAVVLELTGDGAAAVRVNPSSPSSARACALKRSTSGCRALAPPLW